MACLARKPFVVELTLASSEASTCVTFMIGGTWLAASVIAATASHSFRHPVRQMDSDFGEAFAVATIATALTTSCFSSSIGFESCCCSCS